MAGANKEMAMQIHKAFEIVKISDTVMGDLLQISGSWAIRLEDPYILYLNGRLEGGVSSSADDDFCLRLRDFKGLLVDFDSHSQATNENRSSANPLVFVEGGYALHASVGDEDQLYRLNGKRTDMVPYVQSGPWHGSAVRQGTVKTLDLF